MIYKKYKELLVLRDAFNNDTELDFILYIKSQEIEKKSVFEQHFKRTVKAILISFPVVLKGSVQEKMVQWAQTMMDNDYEILERREVLNYWLELEKKKLEKEIEYCSLIRLRNQSKLEATVNESILSKR